MQLTYVRPTARADGSNVLLTMPRDWQTGVPLVLSAEGARDLAGELIAAALTVRFGQPGDH